MSGRPAPPFVRELLSDPPALALQCAQLGYTVSVSLFPSEKAPQPEADGIPKDRRPSTQQAAGLASEECSLPLPHPVACQHVQAVMWLDPEDQILAEAEDPYHSDEENISDSSSLAGAGKGGAAAGDDLEGRGSDPCSCGASGSSGSGSDLRVDTCGSLPEVPPPRQGLQPTDQDQPSSVGAADVAPAFRAVMSQPVQCDTVSTSPDYQSGRSCTHERTKNWPAAASAAQGSANAGCTGSASSIAVDGGGGGGNSSSAYGVSRGFVRGPAGAGSAADGSGAGSCGGKQCKLASESEQLPPKRRCLEGGKASPPPFFQEGACAECRCYVCCKVQPAHVFDPLPQMQPPASPKAQSSGRRLLAAGPGQGVDSQESHSDGILIANRAVPEAGVQVATQRSQPPDSDGTGLGLEEARGPQRPPLLQPTVTAEAGVRMGGIPPPPRSPSKSPADRADPNVRQQPFSRGYAEFSNSASKGLPSSFRVIEAQVWTSQPYLAAPMPHGASSREAQQMPQQQNMGSRTGGGSGGGFSAPPVLFARAQAPTACFCLSCTSLVAANGSGGSPAKGASSVCSCRMLITNGGAAASAAAGAASPFTPATLNVPTRACYNTGMLWTPNHQREDSAAAAAAIAQKPPAGCPGTCSSSMTISCMPHVPTHPTSSSSGPMEESSRSLCCVPQVPQPPSCRCHLCMPVAPSAEPRLQLNQRPSYVRGLQVSPVSPLGSPVMNSSPRASQLASTAVPSPRPCVASCAPSPHGQGPFETPASPPGHHLPHYVVLRSRHMAPPTRLFRHASLPPGSMRACLGSHECAPCGERWANCPRGTSGPGRGSGGDGGGGDGGSQRLTHSQRPCSIKRDVSMPELSFVTGGTGADGASWKPLQHRQHQQWELRSPGGAEEAAAQLESSGASSVGGAQASTLLPESGPNSRSEVTTALGVADLTATGALPRRQQQQQQRQALPSLEATTPQQRQGRVSSGSSSCLGSPPAASVSTTPVAATTVVAAAVSGYGSSWPAAERELTPTPLLTPAETPTAAGVAAADASAVAAVPLAAHSSPNTQQPLLQQNQHSNGHSQEQPSIMQQAPPPQAASPLPASGSARAKAATHTQRGCWQSWQRLSKGSKPISPPWQQSGSHVASSGAAEPNTCQGTSLPLPLPRHSRASREAWSQPAVAVTSSLSSPQHVLPRQQSSHSLVPCAPRPSPAVDARNTGVEIKAAGGLVSCMPQQHELVVGRLVEMWTGSRAQPEGSVKTCLPATAATASDQRNMMQGSAACACPHCRTPSSDADIPSRLARARPQQPFMYTSLKYAPSHLPQEGTPALPVSSGIADTSHWAAPVLADK